MVKYNFKNEESLRNMSKTIQTSKIPDVSKKIKAFRGKFKK